jgi:Flp pilus assembly pilin Flp
MNQTVHRFWNDENGAEMVEWPVLIQLRGLIIDVTRDVLTRMQEDPKDEWAPVP